MIRSFLLYFDAMSLCEISILDLLVPLCSLLLDLNTSGHFRLDMSKVTASPFSNLCLMLSSDFNEFNALHDDLSFLEVLYIFLSYSFLLLKILDGSIIIISYEFFVFSSLLSI